MLSRKKYIYVLLYTKVKLEEKPDIRLSEVEHDNVLALRNRFQLIMISAIMRQHSMYLYCDIQEKFHIKFKSEIALIELINLFLNFDFKMNKILHIISYMK